MKSVIALALVVVLALSAHHALAAECTAETCTSKIVVKQNFQSTDCSGNFTLVASTNYTTKCKSSEVQPGYFTSAATTCSANGGLVILTSVGSNCPSDTAILTQTVAIGVCQRTGATTSQATWCNAQSVGTPKAAKDAVDATVLLDYTGDCNTTTGCGASYGTLTIYSAAGCNAADAIRATSPAYPFTSLTPQLDTCLVDNRTSNTYDNRLNYRATCSNGQYVIRTLTGGCGSGSNFLTSTAIGTGKCLQSSQDQWLLVTCSSASTIAMAPFIMVIFFLAFLLI